jgi:hypothetical protein
LKFKYLIVSFSTIIAIFLLLVNLIPYFILGPEFTANLRNVTIPVSAVMILAFAGIIIFYLFNFKLLKLLEMEDWPALAFYLENQIYNKNKYSSRKVKLLASSYMVISDYRSVIALENRALNVKPDTVYKNILIFGSAHILAGNNSAAFFRNYNDKRIKKSDKQWLRWFYGFSQMLAGQFLISEQEFSFLAVNSPDILITGLSAYFLDTILVKHSLSKDKCRKIAENGREIVKKAVHNIKGWEKEISSMAAEIHASIIKKYLDEAGKWCFQTTVTDRK